MAVSISKKTPLPINNSILQWAREWSGHTIGEAAKRVSKETKTIEDWESGKSSPTVIQARKLADLYERSFLEFFRKEPPNIPEPSLIPDFRLERHASDPTNTRNAKRIQIWAEAQRENALDLFSELGESPPEIPDSLFADINDDPEEKAQHARKVLNFSIEQQVGITNKERTEIPNILRRKIESIGVLTLKYNELKSIKARGYCIAIFPLPMIIVRSEAPSGLAFTLAHEFAHIVLRQSAISGYLTRTGGGTNERKIEKWCDSFAASFLIPKSALQSKIKMPSSPMDSISDVDLSELAKYFGVSEHAMLIRLVKLAYVKADYYWGVKKAEFDTAEKEYKSFGRSKYYGSRFKNSLGGLYTGLVLEAWGSGKITNHNAAEFMGIKKLSHLYDIRENFEV